MVVAADSRTEPRLLTLTLPVLSYAFTEQQTRSPAQSGHRFSRCWLDTQALATAAGPKATAVSFFFLP